MSLQVWLPLRGDLTQQGLSQIEAINHNAVVNDNGKIGKCYQFGADEEYLELSHIEEMKQYTGAFSICMWVKILSWNTNFATLISAYHTYDDWKNLIFSILRYGSNSKLCFTISDGSSYTDGNLVSGELTLDTWYHIACIYKPGNISMYIDGKLISSYNTSVIPDFSLITKCRIGYNASRYQSDCLMNDVRLYNHALTEREVKEISRGLVLHYPLNNNGLGNENLFLGSRNWTWPASSTSNFNYNWIVTSGKLTVGETYTVSAVVETTEPTQKVTIYNYQTQPSVVSGGPITYDFIADGKTRDSWTFTATATGLIAYAGLSTKTIDQTAVYKDLKLEVGDKATPYSPAPSEIADYNTVHDISGFGNDGIVTGVLNILSDTPRYKVSTYFDGSSYIVTDYYSTLGVGDFTISAWVKIEVNSSKTYQPIIINKNTGAASVGCGIYWNHNQNKFLWSTADGSAATEIWTENTFADLYDKWTHVVMVRNADDVKIGYFYINGVREELTSTPVIRNVSNATYPMVIGAIGPHNYATYQYTGGISDVRLYATALSADDIKELYEMGVSE